MPRSDRFFRVGGNRRVCKNVHFVFTVVGKINPERMLGHRAVVEIGFTDRKGFRSYVVSGKNNNNINNLFSDDGTHCLIVNNRPGVLLLGDLFYKYLLLLTLWVQRNTCAARCNVLFFFREILKGEVEKQNPPDALPRKSEPSLNRELLMNIIAVTTFRAFFTCINAS